MLHQCILHTTLYNTGVVLIQGSSCGQWEHTDMKAIKTLLTKEECNITEACSMTDENNQTAEMESSQNSNDSNSQEKNSI